MLRLAVLVTAASVTALAACNPMTAAPNPDTQFSPEGYRIVGFASHFTNNVFTIVQTKDGTYWSCVTPLTELGHFVLHEGSCQTVGDMPGRGAKGYLKK